MNFLREKSDTFEVLKDICQRIQEEKMSVIVKIRNDNDKEFMNAKFYEFCDSEGISYEFSYSWKTQGDGIVEQ